MIIPLLLLSWYNVRAFNEIIVGCVALCYLVSSIRSCFIQAIRSCFTRDCTLSSGAIDLGPSSLSSGLSLESNTPSKLCGSPSENFHPLKLIIVSREGFLWWVGFMLLARLVGLVTLVWFGWWSFLILICLKYPVIYLLSAVWWTLVWLVIISWIVVAAVDVSSWFWILPSVILRYHVSFRVEVVARMV